jgi:ketosteroid isomerase-like protein
MNKYSLLAAILYLFSVACQNQVDIEKMEAELFQTDIAFSNLSIEQGRNAAFIAFCADDAVMLAPNNMPIEGKKIITAKLLSRSDSDYSLTWHPVNAFVAKSGELGYTYGLWNLETADSAGNKLSEQGTYATVWKKNKLGEWKFVLDTGNEGLAPK